MDIGDSVMKKGVSGRKEDFKNGQICMFATVFPYPVASSSAFMENRSSCTPQSVPSCVRPVDAVARRRWLHPIDLRG